MTEESPPSGAADKPREGVGVISAHLLGYAELITTLMQAWQHSFGQKMLGTVLAVCGFTACAVLLTVGAVAAAWPTGYRWPVLLGIAGVYLAGALFGTWLLVRRQPVPAPASVLLDELRKDAQWISEAWRERRT